MPFRGKRDLSKHIFEGASVLYKSRALRFGFAIERINEIRFPISVFSSIRPQLVTLLTDMIRFQNPLCLSHSSAGLPDRSFRSGKPRRRQSPRLRISTPVVTANRRLIVFLIVSRLPYILGLEGRHLGWPGPSRRKGRTADITLVMELNFWNKKKLVSYWKKKITRILRFLVFLLAIFYGQMVFLDLYRVFLNNSPIFLRYNVHIDKTLLIELQGVQN